MGLGYDDVAAVAPGGHLRVGVGLRHQRLAVRRLAGVRVDRRGDVGHLRVQARRRRAAARRTRSARSATSARRCSRSSASSPRCATATRTGEGQHVDIAMFDAIVAMTDIVTNFWSLGKHRLNEPRNAIIDGFRAVRRLVRHAGRPRAPVRAHLASSSATRSGPTDPRLATREGWADHLEDMIRPAIEAWASHMTKLEAVAEAVGRRHRGGAGADRAPRSSPTRTSTAAQHARRDAAHRRRRARRCSSPATR